MIVGQLYRSKKNGRVYKCFYHSEYEPNTYSIKPLKPTKHEEKIYPFPHIRIEYNPNDWELVFENTEPTATIDEIERIGDIYIIKNDVV